MKILITGSSGFIGGRIKKALKGKYDLLTPDRNKLYETIEKGGFDFIIHCAWAGDSKKSTLVDIRENMILISVLGDTLIPMIYFGSGIVYTDDQSDYAVAKSIVHNGLRDHVLNLTLFAVYGRGENPRRIIPKTRKLKKITIDQDQFFDAIHVSDVVKTVRYFLENRWKRNQYDLAAPPAHLLSEIPWILKKKYTIKKEGVKPSYIGNVSNLLQDTPLTFMTLEEGLKKYETA